MKHDMSLAEVGQHYGKNEASIHSTVLNSMHPENHHFSSMAVSLKPYTSEYQESIVL
jgi:hypothetical protein